MSDDGSAERLLRRARRDPAYARLLCRHIAAEIATEPGMLESPLIRFIVDALQLIGDGQDAGRVLGTKSRRGPVTDLQRNVEIAIDYWGLKRDQRPKAKNSVADTWGLDPDHVETIADRYKREAMKQIALRAAVCGDPVFDEKRDLADHLARSRELMIERSRKKVLRRKNYRRGKIKV